MWLDIKDFKGYQINEKGTIKDFWPRLAITREEFLKMGFFIM